MKEVTISIPDKEYSFVMSLLRRFPFVKVKETDLTDKDLLTGLQEAVEEVNEIKQGKKEGKSLQSFLDEL